MSPSTLRRVLTVSLLVLACAAHADQAQIDAVDAALAKYKATQAQVAADRATLEALLAELLAKVDLVKAALGQAPGPVVPPAVLSTNAQHVRDLAVGAVNDRTLAPALAAVYSTAADKIHTGEPGYADEAGAVKQTGAAVQAALGASVASWRPFFTGLQGWLGDEKAAGRLATSAAREAYWRDIGLGLAASAAVGVKQR